MFEIERYKKIILFVWGAFFTITFLISLWFGWGNLYMIGEPDTAFEQHTGMLELSTVHIKLLCLIECVPVLICSMLSLHLLIRNKKRFASIFLLLIWVIIILSIYYESLNSYNF